MDIEYLVIVDEKERMIRSYQAPEKQTFKTGHKVTTLIEFSEYERLRLELQELRFQLEKLEVE